MTKLGHYLGSSRISRHDVPNSQSALHYIPLVNHIRSILKGSEREKCEVIIVYTLNRYSEITNIDGETKLIYDRYSGQALNTLTRILFWSKDSRTAMRAFAKIFAELAIVAGDGAGAIAGALSSSKLNKFWKIPPAGGSQAVSTQVYLQEFFVFAHEYCHMVMASNPEFRESRRRVGNILIESMEYDESHESYKRFAEHYPGMESYEVWRDVGRRHQSFILSHKTELCDELACDDFALNLLVEHCMRQSIAVKYAFVASFLALRNIRTISYIRISANPLLSRSKLDQALPVLLLQARQHLLRNGYTLVAKARGVEADLQNVMDDMIALSDLHDKQIDNPLLEEGLDRLHKARDLVVSSGEDFGILKAFEIARTLGWDPDADTINYLSI